MYNNYSNYKAHITTENIAGSESLHSVVTSVTCRIMDFYPLLPDYKWMQVDWATWSYAHDICKQRQSMTSHGANQRCGRVDRG
jgi:chorismate mutase